MNKEAANKSMGFFAIYEEAYKHIIMKNIFSEITLTILLPTALYFLSEIFIFELGYLMWMLIFSFLSTSSIVCTIACFYTSRDITYKKVTGVLWGRLIVTFLWCFLFLAIFITLTFDLLLLRFIDGKGGIRSLILIICQCISVFAILTYMMVVWSIATVVTVLEKDHYGIKALAKSMNLIKGKICVVFGLLGIAFTGIILTYSYLSVYQDTFSLKGRSFVGIGCHMLMGVWIHILFVVHTVVYFFCKSVQEEDISTGSTHLEVPVIRLGKEKGVE